MTQRAILVVVLAAFLCHTTVSGAEKTVVVELRPGSLTLGTPSKLSAVLQATAVSNGVLQGTDAEGRAVFSMPEENLVALSALPSVASARVDKPEGVTGVTQLKLSYAGKSRPTKDDVAKWGLKWIEDYQKGSFLVVGAERIDAGLAKRVQGLTGIAYASANVQFRAIPPVIRKNRQVANVATTVAPPTNDPKWDDLWGIRNIKSPIAWQASHGGDVVVAVIDTGVDYTHDDLKENMWQDKAGKHGFDFVHNDADPLDDNGHGTHCSGTIGALGNNRIGVVGVNWKVKIMAVRWLDKHGSGNVVAAIKGIDFAIDNEAQVLSNSWFWMEDDPDLEAAVGRAKDKGVLFVAAAGNFAQKPNNNQGDNDNPSTYGRIPSAYSLDNIIAVAAIDNGERLADFSEWGAKSVDLGAPGVSIMSTVPNNAYDGTYSGTSMATPHVAGAAALLLAQQPELTFGQVKDLLLKNARATPRMTGKCVTGGILDISFISVIPGVNKKK